ncbi:hypothetical protein LQZ18_12465 [Lachnospiraceae bacterium ZAX-1]
MMMKRIEPISMMNALPSNYEEEKLSDLNKGGIGFLEILQDKFMALQRDKDIGQGKESAENPVPRKYENDSEPVMQPDYLNVASIMGREHLNIFTHVYVNSATRAIEYKGMIVHAKNEMDDAS